MRCKLSFLASPRKYDAEFFMTLNCFIRPVCGTCGPRQRSISGPLRYTVVKLPSAILSLMMCCLYLFDLNISSLETSGYMLVYGMQSLQIVLGKSQALERLLLLNNGVDDGLERF